MNSTDGNTDSMVATGRFIASVSPDSNVNERRCGMLHMAYTFCLHNGRYEMKVAASISKIGFVKVVSVLCTLSQSAAFRVLCSYN